jgi:hypothetical protein
VKNNLKNSLYSSNSTYSIADSSYSLLNLISAKETCKSANSTFFQGSCKEDSGMKTTVLAIAIPAGAFILLISVCYCMRVKVPNGRRNSINCGLEIETNNIKVIHLLFCKISSIKIITSTTQSSKPSTKFSSSLRKIKVSKSRKSNK